MYASDAHGDNVRLYDTSSSTLTPVATNYYDSFGNGGANEYSRLGYAGEYHDAETGFIYLRARYYDPAIGRFISEDPIRDGLNWYVYANNNPLIFIDPWGLKPSDLEAAYMSKHIYDATPKDYLKDLGNNFGGWTLMDIIDGDEGLYMGVYYRNVDGVKEYALVNKGTNSWGDWVNNLQQPFGFSTDMKNSIQEAKAFVNEYNGYEITMVGHSKGGAEAVANAVATNTNCIVFNPATTFLSSYNLSVDNYTAKMDVYVVDGEMLNAVEGWFSKPIDKLIPLKQKHPTWAILPEVVRLYNSYKNHGMEAVIWGLNNR